MSTQQQPTNPNDVEVARIKSRTRITLALIGAVLVIFGTVVGVVTGHEPTQVLSDSLTHFLTG